jgi:hypothetical protein
MFSFGRHAGVGAVYRRGPAADALRAHRPRHHAEGRDAANLQTDVLALLALMLVAMVIAVRRFRRTLD